MKIIFKKFIAVSLILSGTCFGKILAREPIPTPNSQNTQSSQSLLNDSQIAQIKELIKEEIEIHSQEEALEKELDRKRKQCKKYRKLLAQKENYISPENVQKEVTTEKMKMLLEFNKYLYEYFNNSENKEKKLKCLNLDKALSGFINLNFTINNPKKVNLAPSLIKGEAKASVI